MATKFVSIQYPPELLEEWNRDHLEWLFRETLGIQEVRWTEDDKIGDFVIDGASEGVDRAEIRQLLWGEGVWDGCNEENEG